MKSDRDMPSEYAEVAVVAREVGQEMLTRLNLVALKPRYILELGSGAGFCTQLLRERYSDAVIVAIDISEKMLEYAKKQAKAVHWLCADAFKLPILPQKFDLIVANLLIPWLPDLNKLLNEWRQVLRSEGLFVFTSFGPDTLKELHEYIPLVPRLMDMHDLGDGLIRAGFADPVLDVEQFTLRYREKEQLIRELYLTQMITMPSVDSVNKENLPLSITYEAIYGHAWGTVFSGEYPLNEEGVVKIPLSDLQRKR